MATGTKLDDFYARFGADFKELLTEFKKAEAASTKFRSTVTKEMAQANAVIDRITGQIRGAVLGLVGGFGLLKIGQFARDTLKWADDTKTLADRLGISTDALQELNIAGREVNITSKEMAAGLQSFWAKITEAASGKGRGVTAFQALGIDPAQIKNTEDALTAVAEKIAQFNRPSQIAIAKQLFGDDALRFLDLLGGGVEKFKARLVEARALGPIISAEDIERGEKINKQFERLTDNITGQLRKAVIELGPALEGVATATATILATINSWVKGIQDADAAARHMATIPMPEWPKNAKSYLDKVAKAVEAVPKPGGQKTLGQIMEGFVPPNLDAMAFQDAAAREAARQKGAKPTEGTRSVNLSGAGAAQAETFRKFMEDLKTATAQATAALDPFKAALAEVDGKLAKMNATTAQGALAKAEFNKKWDALGAKALAEFGAESEQLAKIAEAEAMGRRDLVAVLETEFSLRQKLGDKFVNDNKAQIEAMAKLRFEIDEHRKKVQDLQSGIASALESGAMQMTDAFAAFFDKNRSGWEEMRNAALNTLRAISDEILKIMLIRPLAQAGASWLTSLFGIGSSIAGGISGGGGATSMTGLSIPGIGGRAEGGPVSAGVPYIVGEKRPEVFVPSVSGTIMPRVPMGGSVTLVGAPDHLVRIDAVEAMLKSVRIEVRRVNQSIEPRSVAAIVDARRRGGAVAGAFG